MHWGIRDLCPNGSFETIGALIADVVINVGNLLARKSLRRSLFECQAYKVGECQAFDCLPVIACL